MLMGCRGVGLLALSMTWGCEEPSTSTDTSTATDPTVATTDDDDDDSTEADDTGDGGPCGGGQCGAEVPDGWIGPVIRSIAPQDSTPPDCPEDWPDKDLSFFDAFIEPDPATCSCTCSVDYAALCYTGLWRHDGSATCDSFTEFVSIEGGECLAIDTTTGSLDLEVIGAGAPDCEAMLEETLPEPAWGNLVSACRLEEEGEACGDADGTCIPAVPEGFEPGVCIYQQGDAECPGDPWTERSLVYNGVAEDSRNCTPCTCGEVGELTCDGTVTPFAEDDCSGAEGTSVDPDSCGTVDGAASVRFDYDGPETCEMLTETMLMGAIAPGPVFTYCCSEAGA